MVITGDAAHARHATAAYIAGERGGAYALTVKGNRPGLLAQITAMLPPALQIATWSPDCYQEYVCASHHMLCRVDRVCES